MRGAPGFRLLLCRRRCRRRAGDAAAGSAPGAPRSAAQRPAPSGHPRWANPAAWGGGKGETGEEGDSSGGGLPRCSEAAGGEERSAEPRRGGAAHREGVPRAQPVPGCSAQRWAPPGDTGGTARSSGSRSGGCCPRFGGVRTGAPRPGGAHGASQSERGPGCAAPWGAGPAGARLCPFAPRQVWETSSGGGGEIPRLQRPAWGCCCLHRAPSPRGGKERSGGVLGCCWHPDFSKKGDCVPVSGIIHRWCPGAWGRTGSKRVGGRGWSGGGGHLWVQAPRVLGCWCGCV